VWAVVDIGYAIAEIAGDDDKDKAIAAALRVLRCVPRPVLAACGAFSFSWWWPGLPMSFVLTFVLVMPALTQLHLIVNEGYSDVPSADLVGLIPAADVAEWRGRGWWPAEVTGMVTVDHLLRAISSLTSLTDLTIEVYHKVSALTMFPRSLHRLTMETFYGVDVSELFGAGPHNQIRELEIRANSGGVQEAVRACPEITALTIYACSFTQNDLDSILSTSKNLQQLCIGSVDPLSFACLESSSCARSLTNIKANKKLAPGSIEIISRCCPAIEELSVCDVCPADVHAMASLMRLRVLEMRCDSDEDQGPELSEALTTLGNTAGVTPFTRLVLESIKFDVTGFFSSHRCSALRELVLDDCNRITRQAMQALATNVRDSLESLLLLWVPVVPIVPLLVECCRLEHLTLHKCGTEAMEIIGQMCKAPLRLFKFTGNMTDDDAVRAIMPALVGVMFLGIECSTEAILQHIIPQCPCLQMIRVCSPDIAKQLRSVIPKHITVIL
jgi:hypothetical protein